MTAISFKTELSKIGSSIILKLPKSASSKLPSRGLVMVKGTINDIPFQEALEPDGRGSHWFKLSKTMSTKIKKDAGDSVTLNIEVVDQWPEPKVPTDLDKALSGDKEAKEMWKDITPLARWDWIRWIRSTKNPETRKIRIDKAFSKLKQGKRAACCFNRSECTDPEVSSRGVLLEPTKN